LEENFSEKKVGFVSLIGRPSSGKSTLINTICGFKISIVSKHPQTTRFLVRGIFNDDDSQIIFVDTPGFHNFNSNLNRGLSNLAVRNLADCDLVLYLVDTTREFGDEENQIIEKLIGCQSRLIVAFNKIDDKNSKDSIKNIVKEKLKPKAFCEISGLNGKNIDILLKSIKECLDLGHIYYPEDYVTDQTIPFRITEVVREQIFNTTTEEVPHSTYVEVDSLDVKENNIKAYCTIYVEKDSQKGIIIGKGGKMIKTIGEKARISLKDIFEREVSLFLNVKLNLNWRKKDKLLKKMFQLE